MRLVLRTGGKRDYPWHEALTKPVTIEIDGVKREVPAPIGTLFEITFELPRGHREIDVHATGPYHAFHWFVLAPD